MGMLHPVYSSVVVRKLLAILLSYIQLFLNFVKRAAINFKSFKDSKSAHILSAASVVVELYALSPLFTK